MNPELPLASVELRHAYRLLNHGPTVLVSARHGDRDNLMAAAWAMPLDFDPPKVAVVIDKSTLTRGLVEASGVFALSVPCRAIADATYAVGSRSGHEVGDKFAAAGLAKRQATVIDAPLVEAAVAWLECRLIDDPALPAIAQRYDLFLGEVLAAQADTRVFSGGRWHFAPGHDALRTIHHIAAGAFFVAGDVVQAKAPG